MLAKELQTLFNITRCYSIVKVVGIKISVFIEAVWFSRKMSGPCGAIN